MCQGFLLRQFWRILPGILDFSGHFFPQRWGEKIRRQNPRNPAAQEWKSAKNPFCQKPTLTSRLLDLWMYCAHTSPAKRYRHKHVYILISLAYLGVQSWNETWPKLANFGEIFSEEMLAEFDESELRTRRPPTDAQFTIILKVTKNRRKSAKILFFVAFSPIWGLFGGLQCFLSCRGPRCSQNLSAFWQNCTSNWKNFG